MLAQDGDPACVAASTRSTQQRHGRSALGQCRERPARPSTPRVAPACPQPVVVARGAASRPSADGAQRCCGCHRCAAISRALGPEMQALYQQGAAWLDSGVGTSPGDGRNINGPARWPGRDARSASAQPRQRRTAVNLLLLGRAGSGALLLPELESKARPCCIAPLRGGWHGRGPVWTGPPGPALPVVRSGSARVHESS